MCVTEGAFLLTALHTDLDGQMNYVFGVKTKTHVKYQLGTVRPWFIKHYFWRDRQAVCPPLYRYDRSRDVNSTGSGNYLWARLTQLLNKLQHWMFKSM